MGHNLIFDYSFLKHQAADQKIPFEKNGIDTLKIARTLLPDLESRSLTNLCGYFQIDRAHAHRAYHDALATHETVSTSDTDRRRRAGADLSAETVTV